MTPIEELTAAINRMNQLLESRDEDLCKSFADSSCSLIEVAYGPIPVKPRG